MLVAGIMKKKVVTISPLATVREALMMMKDRGVKSLVVEKRHSGDVAIGDQAVSVARVALFDHQRFDAAILHHHQCLAYGGQRADGDDLLLHDSGNQHGKHSFSQ